MKIETLEALRPRFDSFMSRFDDCIRTRPSRRHLHTYVNGQLGPLARKSVEPIALEAGVPPRSLQEFLEIHKWDEQKLAARVRTETVTRHPSASAIAVIDETGFAKKGEKTAGIQRQYCGATGKIDNCVITVHLGYVTDDFHTLVDSDLYLPRKTWALDPDRRRAAGIPDDLVFRPKWRIALDLLTRSAADGVRFKYAVADEEYGKVPEFRRGLANLELLYVLEVPTSTYGWTAAMAGRAERARRVDALWERGGPSWRTYHVKDTEKGAVVWEARAVRFSPREDQEPGEERWLLVVRNVVSGEVKYFLSNLPADAPCENILHVAFTRAEVEQLFEECKGEVGIEHFEVRHYRPLMRHLALSMVSLLFLNEEARRLRGKKPVVEHLADPSGDRRAA